MDIEKEIEEIKEKQNQLEERVEKIRKEILGILAEAFKILGVGFEGYEKREAVRLGRKVEEALSK